MDVRVEVARVGVAILQPRASSRLSWKRHGSERCFAGSVAQTVVTCLCQGSTPHICLETMKPRLTAVLAPAHSVPCPNPEHQVQALKQLASPKSERVKTGHGTKLPALRATLHQSREVASSIGCHLTPPLNRTSEMTGIRQAPGHCPALTVLVHGNLVQVNLAELNGGRLTEALLSQPTKLPQDVISKITEGMISSYGVSISRSSLQL